MEKDRYLKIYNGSELIAKTRGWRPSYEGDNGDTLIKVNGLNPDTVYQEGALQAVWEIDGVESEKVDIPEFQTVYVKAKYFSFRREKMHVRVNESETLFPVVGPINTTNSAKTMTSKNPDIATIDENGIVYGISPGIAEIEGYANEIPDKKKILIVKVLAENEVLDIEGFYKDA